MSIGPGTIMGPSLGTTFRTRAGESTLRARVLHAQRKNQTVELELEGTLEILYELMTSLGIPALTGLLAT